MLGNATAPRDDDPEGGTEQRDDASNVEVEGNGLVVPVLPADASTLDIALALAAAGFYVLPTRAADPKHAGSRLGKGWPGKSSRDPDQLAAWFAGTDDRVAVHCGRSGLLVVDVDHDDQVPDVLRKAIESECPPFQSTRPDDPGRGHHLFATPPGRRLGNRVGPLGGAWGEVRGQNGIILVGGPGREFFQTGAVPVLPDYVADLLPDVGEAGDAATDADVEAFERAHTASDGSRRHAGPPTWFADRLRKQQGRHPAMMAVIPTALREAAAGVYPAAQVRARLLRAFVDAMARRTRPGDRVLGERQAVAEFAGMWSWGVGQVLAEQPAMSPAGAAGPAEPAGAGGLRNAGSAPAAAPPEGSVPAAERAADASAATVEGDGPGEQDATATAVEREVLAEVRRLDVRDEAARRRRARDRAGRPSLASRLIDVTALDDIEPPSMLLGALIPDRAVGFLGGRSGAYKSFLAVGWACALAAGRPWLGAPEFAVRAPVRVLYVAAEGAAGVRMRVRAWEKRYGTLPAGSLVVHREPIRLNDADAADELVELVGELGIGFVVLDTWRRSAPGVEDNSTTEFGEVFEQVARIRDEHGATVLMLDHTGHAGERLRGASAKGDDADYVLIASYDGQDRGPEVPRRLRVDKLKDAETVGAWPIRVRDAVAEVGAPDQSSPFPTAGEWWNDTVAIPDDVVERLHRSKAKGKGAAPDIYRVLAYVDAPGGMTRGEVSAAVAEGPRKHSKSSVHAGLALLEAVNVVCIGDTPSRFRLRTGAS